jgi:hypothetical protein
MHKIRREDRTIIADDAFEILKNAEFGILSTVDKENQPYGVPLSFCVYNKNIYFHCAKEGYKINNLDSNSKVSFCVVGNTKILPDQFSTNYESTIVFGRAEEVFDDEKYKALEQLIFKYSKDFFEEGVKYINASKENTKVYKISIEFISGKARK